LRAVSSFIPFAHFGKNTEAIYTGIIYHTIKALDWSDWRNPR